MQCLSPRGTPMSGSGPSPVCPSSRSRWYPWPYVCARSFADNAGARVVPPSVVAGVCGRVVGGRDDCAVEGGVVEGCVGCAGAGGCHSVMECG
eukprot:1432368-Amphidinium_carterae.1